VPENFVYKEKFFFYVIVSRTRKKKARKKKNRKMMREVERKKKKRDSRITSDELDRNVKNGFMENFPSDITVA